MSGFRWLSQQYFLLPRWERIGIICLISVIFSLTLAMYLWPSPELTAKELAELNAAEQKVNEQLAHYKKKVHEKNFDNSSEKKYSNNNSGKLHAITDIYTATPSQLINAGLTKKVAFNLYNYIKKGGRINSAKDLSRIYGITNEMVDKLSKYITVDTSSQNSLTASAKGGPPAGWHTSPLTANRNDTKSIIKPKADLNTSDSAQLAGVYGISPKMAAVIIKFRKKIFAFHSVEQLNEIFKEPLKNFETIKEGVEVKNFKPCIAINEITLDELKKHLYFKKDNLAAGLIAYRDKHGKFKNENDLKKCVLVTEEILVKIRPYVSYE